MFGLRLGARATMTLAALIATSFAVDAKCTRLGFSVNDYGKDGPTKDAKALLDKYIANWANENGIKKYNVGKKDVKCELFLDVILFDEHTCRAEAPVCWDGATASAKAPATTPAATSRPLQLRPQPAAATAAAKAPAKPAIETSSIKAVAPAVKAPATPAVAPAAVAPAAVPAAVAPVAVPAAAAPAAVAPAAAVPVEAKKE